MSVVEELLAKLADDDPAVRESAADDDVPPGGVGLYRFDECPDMGRAIV